MSTDMKPQPMGQTLEETWLKRPLPTIKPRAKQILTAVETEPSTQCPNCNSIITNTALIFNNYVCPSCDEHLSMTARTRLNWFFDQVDDELGQQYQAGNPLDLSLIHI